MSHFLSFEELYTKKNPVDLIVGILLQKVFYLHKLHYVQKIVYSKLQKRHLSLLYYSGR